MSLNTDNYIIAGGKAGMERLNVLADVLEPYTGSLLVARGLVRGSSFLDVGCGGGNVARLAAKMVTDSGSVTAVDFDAEIIKLAQADAEKEGIQNISFAAIDAGKIAYQNEFDFAYARFLLSHVRSPSGILQKMTDSVKQGGKVIVEDVDFRGHFCHPACDAFAQYIEWYTLAATQNGADANIGPALYMLFQNAGLTDIGFDIIQPCFHTGPGKWMAFYTLDKIKAALIDNHIATKTAIDQALAALEAFTKDENTIISLPRIFRLWGTKK